MIECRRLLFGSDRLPDIVQLLPLPQQIIIQFGRALSRHNQRNRPGAKGKTGVAVRCQVAIAHDRSATMIGFRDPTTK
jgi:hypothetical protein